MEPGLAPWFEPTGRSQGFWSTHLGHFLFVFPQLLCSTYDSFKCLWLLGIKTNRLDAVSGSNADGYLTGFQYGPNCVLSHQSALIRTVPYVALILAG